MENFDLNFMNGVVLIYCLDKYDRGTVTIEIQNGETKLTSVDIDLLGSEITENFETISQLKNIQFNQDDCFEVYPKIPLDDNDNYGQIYFEGGSIEDYYFQDIESPLKEILFENEILKGGGILYFNIFWEAFRKEVWK